VTISEILETTVVPDLGPTTAAEIQARAEAAVPVLREHSAEIESSRRLPEDVAEIVRSTGVFRMALPKAWGGPELTFAEQTKVIETLSYGDSAAGWCAMIGMDTWIYAGYLEESAAREMLVNPDAITAGMIFPVGRAERVPGGYRVTGRWPFGSGVTHSDWLIGGCLVYRDGKPEEGPGGEPTHWRVMMARTEEFEILDTWYTTGLAGSGSRDYQVTDLFVPEEHSFSFTRPHISGPLSQPDAILGNVPGVPLGVARAALDHVRELADGRVDKGTGQPWKDTYRVQTTIGEAEMALSAARFAVYGSLERLWECYATGTPLTAEERVASALARVNAFRTARAVVSRLSDLVGASSIYRTSPLDRWVRDTHTMCQHILAQDQIVQSAGAYLLGGTPQAPFPLGILG
jgi:alkylation response protein AidB-like acyl-CoA dehydrogenase